MNDLPIGEIAKRSGLKVSAMCQQMMREKLAEVDHILAHLREIRRTLAESLNCDCSDLNECAYTLKVKKER